MSGVTYLNQMVGFSWLLMLAADSCYTIHIWERNAFCIIPLQFYFRFLPNINFCHLLKIPLLQGKVIFKSRWMLTQALMVVIFAFPPPSFPNETNSSVVLYLPWKMNCQEWGKIEPCWCTTRGEGWLQKLSCEIQRAEMATKAIIWFFTVPHLHSYIKIGLALHLNKR